MIKRDYDLSLPELIGDREKLIQAVLNIARNAVQAMQTNKTPLGQRSENGYKLTFHMRNL